jgi:hypothetical protein
MNRFKSRLLIVASTGMVLALLVLVLSQWVSYKPWGVPDSRREEYDHKLAELQRQTQLREASRSVPTPDATVFVPRHDFGWWSEGEALHHSFVIMNKGNKELEVALRQTNLPYLSASLESAIVPPGGQVACNVSLTVPAAGAAAERHDSEADSVHRVSVVTNDPLDAQLTLTVSGKYRRPLVLPSKLDFGAHDMGVASTVSFVLYSQQWSEFSISDVLIEEAEVDWYSEACDPAAEDLLDQAATSAVRLTIKADGKGYGVYTGKVKLIVQPESQEFFIDFEGRIRPPIGFYGPNVDRRDGIDLGTLQSGRRHEFFVAVRSRSDKSRKIAVLKIEPEELEAELKPLKQEGSYQLRISVPEDCPDLRFNLSTHRGYVQVGDPLQPSYSGGLPIYGVVSDAQQD